VPFAFSACPHDLIRDAGKWDALTSYLIENTRVDFDFVRHTDFDRFASEFSRFQFVYAHPLHAVQLQTQFAFTPVAKYRDVYDEAVIIARDTGAEFTLDKLQGQKVACVYGSPSHAATLIAISQTSPGVSFTPARKPHYPAVSLGMRAAEAPYGIILKSVWENMPNLRSGLNVVYTTNTCSLVHVFMISPALAAHSATLKRVLLDMVNNPQGNAILKRLECSAIAGFGEGDLACLRNTLAVCNF
jgi:hypothetical protein